MPLNSSRGNMYTWLSHTWNTVKGECPHKCSYCYCKRWGKQPALHFDKRELKTDLGEDNFVFVGSSCDLFAEEIPHDWIINTLTKCNWYDSRFLFQSKNPARMARIRLDDWLGRNRINVCTTIETNRYLPEIMGASPRPEARAEAMGHLSVFPRYVTIEPILAFDLAPLVELVKRCEPAQVNIGADSGRNNLPEPSRNAVMELIDDLSLFTRVEKKANLKRITG